MTTFFCQSSPYFQQHPKSRERNRKPACYVRSRKGFSHMASPAQISANLANSKFSTGPKTPETKSISAANSRGPIARFLLSSEDTEEHRVFIEEITNAYN